MLQPMMGCVLILSRNLRLQYESVFNEGTAKSVFAGVSGIDVRQWLSTA